jgi:hypothetical protein
VNLNFPDGHLDEKQSVPDSLFFIKPYRPAEVVSKCKELVAKRN